MQIRLFRKMVMSVAGLAWLGAGAQVDHEIVSYENVPAAAYVRLQYDNDFFTNADWYYTQGIALEVVHPSLKKFPLTKLLLHPKGSTTRYGISANSFGYTPTSISYEEIQRGDRPYAGVVYFSTFALSTDTLRKRRISTAINLGLIGEGTGLAEMQKNIHRWLNNEQPKGWQNQVRNDAVLNYTLNYEQQLASFRNIFLVSAGALLEVGTLHNKLSTGGSLMLGNFINPFTGKSSKRHFHYFIYLSPQLSLVGYDATLQGGIFNRKSPYTIASGDICRFTYQSNFGVVLSFRKFSLEYGQSYLSREFNTGLAYHRWGGIKGCFFL